MPVDGDKSGTLAGPIRGKDQLRQEGKPEAMLDNIAKGKLKRFFKDNTLVNQAFIKDGKVSVADYVKSEASTEVTAFERVALV